MKKSIHLAILLFVTVCSFAQPKDSIEARVRRVSAMPRLEDYNKWEVGVHAGLTYPNTDIAASDLNADTYRGHLGYGLTVNRFFAHSFAVQLQFIRAQLQGIDVTEQKSYVTQIDHEVTLNAFGQIGNISFVKRNSNLGFYGYVGIGYTHFNPTNSIGGVEQDSNILTTAVGKRQFADYKNTTELVVPFGVGIRYRFLRSWSIHAEYTLRTMRSDKLDGWYRVLSDNDGYSYFNLGVSFGFGKKDKTIEWVNPLETIYADLYDVKDRLDMQTQDTDNDGVPDAFDKDNSTPEGVKVYGDGTAVDSDADGVPDHVDLESFSAKGAVVDAQGREVDTDGDGIADSKDLEPNTPKTEMVNQQGISYGNILSRYNLSPSTPTTPAPGTTSTSTTTTTTPGGTTPSGATTTTTAEVAGALGNGYVPSIYFPFNSSQITPNYGQTLANIALLMKENPSMRFQLTAHCDERGSPAVNDALSQKRAQAVMNHLVKNYKIDASRFSIVPKGENDPLTTKYEINRRVDIRLVK